MPSAGRGVCSNDPAIESRAEGVEAALDVWDSQASSVENDLASLVAAALWSVPQVVRVAVAKRRVGGARVVRVCALVSEASRSTRRSVHAVEQEIVRRFPEELFEFACQLDREFVPAGALALFSRAASRFQ